MRVAVPTSVDVATAVTGLAGLGAAGAGQHGQDGGSSSSMPQQHEPSGPQHDEAWGAVSAGDEGTLHPASHGATTSAVTATRAWMSRANAMHHGIVDGGMQVRASCSSDGANNRTVPDEQPENLDAVEPPSGLARAFARPTISTHPPCVTCGYDLQGLPEDGVCPECGEAVRNSLSIELLGHLPPEQLKALRRGAGYVQWGVVVFGVSVPLAFMRPAIVPTGAGWIGAILPVIAHVTSVVLTGVGWWILTERRGPWWAGAIEKRGTHIRVLTMVVVLMDALRGVLMLAGGEAFPLGVYRSVTGGDPWRIANMAAFFIAGFAGLARFFLTTNLILDYAKRMPSTQLAKQARSARVAVPILGVVGAALCGIGPVIAWALYLGLIDNLRWSLKLVAWRKGSSG